MSAPQLSGPFYRAAGLSYLRYANIAADLLRSVLKEPFKTKAQARQVIAYRFSAFLDGKAARPSEPHCWLPRLAHTAFALCTKSTRAHDLVAEHDTSTSLLRSCCGRARNAYEARGPIAVMAEWRISAACVPLASLS